MGLYLVENGVMPTTAARVAQPTGTAIRTMLQLKPLVPLKIYEWGISFNASALAVPVVVELIETGTVFATVSTALAEADVTKVDNPDSDLAADVMSFGTTATGFATAANTEGTITAVRSLDAAQFISVLSQPTKFQFPLGTGALVRRANCARIRVIAPADVNCRCYMKVSPTY